MSPPDDATPATTVEPSAVPIVAPRASDAPTEAVSPQPDTATDLAQTEQPNSTKRTTDAQRLTFFAEIEAGATARAAAHAAGIPLRTGYWLLARADEDEVDLKAAVTRIMRAGAADAIDQWRVAMDVGARKKGNHAPARDWLLHAGVIDAIDSDAPNVRIAINIGTDDQPMRIASPLRYKVDDE